MSDIDALVPGAHITRIGEVEGVGAVGVLGEVKGPGAVGLYFMQPNAQTTVFSLEDEDDGTTDEYYGPCHEFYYILVGEFTMYWGKDALEIRKGKANKLHLKAGDMGYWSRGAANLMMAKTAVVLPHSHSPISPNVSSLSTPKLISSTALTAPSRVK